MNESPLEAALTLIEGLIAQRDAIYSQTVQPRRNVRRALESLLEGDQGGDHEYAAWCLDEAKRGLESVAQLYREYTQAPDGADSEA